MTGVLDGIRVLDFGRFIAAPFCAALLGDLGAEVIRIDREGGNDDRWVVPLTEGGDGSTFLGMNRNKKGITLDITTPDGREAFNNLLATADVVITNLPGDGLQQLGLDYDSLVKIKPDIIATNVSTFGSIGPYRGRVGFDTMAQAMSGAMHLTGDGTTPMRMAVPWADFGTAFCAVIGTLAAIIERNRSGKGQKVEAALMHTALAMSSAPLIEQAVKAPNHRATGNRGIATGPSDAYKARDGWIVVSVVGNAMFRRLCKMLDAPAMADDKRFANDQLRGDHGIQLSEIMQTWVSQRTVAEAIADLEKARIPSAPILTPQQAMDDPHVQAEAFLKLVEHPGLKQGHPVVTAPFRLSRTPATVRRRAPMLNEHTDEILSEARLVAANAKRRSEA